MPSSAKTADDSWIDVKQEIENEPEVMVTRVGPVGHVSYMYAYVITELRTLAQL